MDTVTTQSYFVEYAEIIWLVVGFALIAVELSLAPGVGLLFAGMAGISLGGLLAFGVVDAPDMYQQLTYFFALTAVWAAILWVPLKRYLRSSTGIFDMYAGTIAIVQDGGIGKVKSGKVRWSGSDMRARVTKESERETINADEEVYVHYMRNGVMYVDIIMPNKIN